MNKSIEQVTALALSWVGYLEKSKAAYDRNHDIVYEKTAGAGYDNYTMTWQDTYPSMQGSYWCMNFIYWLFVMAFGVDMAKRLLRLDDWRSYEPWTRFACFSWADNFERHGARYQSSKAQVGDLIFFTRSHVGIVYKIEGGYVYTVEGNTSIPKDEKEEQKVENNGGAIWKKRYKLGIDAIYCYGRPNWGAAQKAPEDRPTIKAGYDDADRGGSWCATIQKSMNEINTAGLDTDGSCGPLTTAAIKAFQQYAKGKGLYTDKIDGSFGPNTWAALDALHHVVRDNYCYYPATDTWIRSK